MECKIDPKLPYTDLSTMIRRQRQVRSKAFSFLVPDKLCSFYSFVVLARNAL